MLPLQKQDLNTCLLFSLENILFSVDIAEVESIIEPQAITELPVMPFFVDGGFSFREHAATAINLKKILRLKDSETNTRSALVVTTNTGNALGFKVDRVIDIVDRESFTPRHAMFSVPGIEVQHLEKHGLVIQVSFSTLINQVETFSSEAWQQALGKIGDTTEQQSEDCAIAEGVKTADRNEENQFKDGNFDTLEEMADATPPLEIEESAITSAGDEATGEIEELQNETDNAAAFEEAKAVEEILENEQHLEPPIAEEKVESQVPFTNIVHHHVVADAKRGAEDHNPLSSDADTSPSTDSEIDEVPVFIQAEIPEATEKTAELIDNFEDVDRPRFSVVGIDELETEQAITFKEFRLRRSHRNIFKPRSRIPFLIGGVSLVVVIGALYFYAEKIPALPSLLTKQAQEHSADMVTTTSVQTQAQLSSNKGVVGASEIQRVVEIDTPTISITVDRPASSNAKNTQKPPMKVLLGEKANHAGTNAVSTRHVVKSGDTLWRIAETVLEDPYRYPELARASGINNPDLIFPGDIVTVTVAK
ncbi:MAG: chemotaxis protein CheW [Gammaproteobacteria bacterium]|nr:chemotaxis protein CheW [Gammaproteobacteria bacterium]